MLEYAEMLVSNGEYIIVTEKERIQLGKYNFYLSALNEASKQGWRLVHIIVIPSQYSEKYIICRDIE